MDENDIRSLKENYTESGYLFSETSEMLMFESPMGDHCCYFVKEDGRSLSFDPRVTIPRMLRRMWFH